MFYFYTLQSLKDKNLYSGYTRDLKKRIKEHNNGHVISTKDRIPFEIVYKFSYLEIHVFSLICVQTFYKPFNKKF